VIDYELNRALREGRPYFGHVYACGQGRPERHVYMRALVEHFDAQLPQGPLRILEIGSWAGGSAVTWAKALQSTGREGEVWCVDSWKPHFDLTVDSGDVYREMNAGATSGDIIRIFHHNLRACGVDDRVVVLKGRSQDVLPRLSPRTFDIIFIDGSHSYADVLADIQISKGLLKNGGALCGDDFEIHWGNCDPAALDAAVASGIDYSVYGTTSFHPGVTAALRDAVGTVSAFEGFWVAQIVDERATPVELRPHSTSIPEHLIVSAAANLATEDSTRLFNVVRVDDKRIAVARSLGIIDLFHEPVGLREFPPLLLIDENDARLRERIAAIEAAERPVLQVVEERLLHVVVRGGDKVYAVARTLGPVNLLLDRLGDRELPAVLLIDNDEERLRERLVQVESAAVRPAFEVIEERPLHMLIRGGDTLYAVSRSLGPVDLLETRLGEREIPGVLLIDSDETRLRARLEELERAAYRPAFEVIEQRDTHMLVRGDDTVYAVARSLGPIDLLRDRIGERELPGILLIDRDEKRLRARLADIEARAAGPALQ
jgi:predicted O-methyltransferase YrrM